jgi:hypothetical protein
MVRGNGASFMLFIGCYMVLRFNDIPFPEVLKCCLQFLIFKKGIRLWIYHPEEVFLLRGNPNEILLEIPVDDK